MVEPINITRNHNSLARALGYKIDIKGTDIAIFARTEYGSHKLNYVATITRPELFTWLSSRHDIKYAPEMKLSASFNTES